MLEDFHEVPMFDPNGHKTKKKESISIIEDWIVSILSRIFVWIIS